MARDGDNLDFDEKMFCLFKGDPGTAKSPAAASWPEPYFIDLEGRIASTVNYWRGIGSKPPYKKKIMYDTFINDYPGMMDKFEKLMNYNPYGTIVMDGFTVLSRSLHSLSFDQRGSAGAVTSKKDKDRDRQYKVIGAKGDFKGIQMMEIDDWYVENNGIIQVLDAMRALWKGGKGCHCICIGHVIEVESRDLTGKVTYTRRMMTGGKKIGAEIPVYFNEAYHFECSTLGERSFKILTRNAGDDWAKTVLPIKDEVDFTNKSLFDEIQNQVTQYKADHPDLFKKEVVETSTIT